MTKILSLVLFCGASSVVGAPAPQDSAVLKNDQIVEMVKGNLTPSLIISQIRSSQTNFDLSTSELIRLSKAGVPESVIAVMRSPKAAPSAAAAVKTVKLGDGEKVRLVLMQDISSSTATQGDRINLTAAEDLKVGDVVVIAKGATASGTISVAKKKGMLGQGGKLTMALEYVKAVDGQNIRVRATTGREGDDQLGKTVVVAVLTGPFALLVKGKDVASPKGTEYTAYIDEARDIVVAQ